MGLQPLLNKDPKLLLWASAWAARIKMIENFVHKFLIYCVFYIVYVTQFTSVIVCRIIQSGVSWVGDPCHTRY